MGILKENSTLNHSNLYGFASVRFKIISSYVNVHSTRVRLVDFFQIECDNILYLLLYLYLFCTKI